MSRNVSKGYQPTNIKLISKDLMNVIHYHYTERKLSLIKEESVIFGLLFLGDDATISRMLPLNIMVSGKIFQ